MFVVYRAPFFPRDAITFCRLDEQGKINDSKKINLIVIVSACVYRQAIKQNYCSIFSAKWKVYVQLFFTVSIASSKTRLAFLLLCDDDGGEHARGVV